MKFTGANIEDGKRRGEWAELRFMARASQQGPRVSKPWETAVPYDFIIEQLRADGTSLHFLVKYLGST